MPGTASRSRDPEGVTVTRRPEGGRHRCPSGGCWGDRRWDSPHGPLPERQVTVSGDMEVRRLWVRPGGMRGDHAQVGAGCARWPQVPGALPWGVSRTPGICLPDVGKPSPAVKTGTVP